MMESNSSHRWALVVAAALAILALAAVAAVVINRYRYAEEVASSLSTQDQTIGETTTRMAELRNKSRFDEAIALGLNSIKGVPSDDYILHAIATIYFVRALHDKNDSGKWTKLGAEYSEKALHANPADIANQFNVGVNFMVVGDDLDTGGCDYYRKSLAIFEGLVPRLQGDHAETQGRTVQLAPFRKRNEEYLSRLRSRLSRCS